MSKLQKYDSYKDSGVEWVGNIPEHWEIIKIKYLMNEKKKTYNMNLNCGSISFGKVVYKDDEKISFSTKKAYQVVEKGNFLVNPLNLNYDLKSLRIALSDLNVVVSSGYIVLDILRDINKAYLNYLLHRFDVAFMKTLGAGVRQTLNYTDISECELIEPPMEEQIKIAFFLDTKTEQLDKAITQKEQLIELLKERRQILINDAVTKGIDKTVAMKDSGVEWIGEIPEHWDIKKLKYLLVNKLKYGANESGIEYSENLPRYVRITDFSNSGKLSEKNKLSLSWENGKEYLLKDGDILFARSGATVGKTYQFKKSMSKENLYSFAGYLIKAEADENKILSDYLYLYTNSNVFESWKERIFIKATIENIGADKYSQLLIIVPSIKEQIKILEKYNLENKKIDKAINLQQQQITKLKEYKTTLIDSVVTGKVRVCDD